MKGTDFTEILRVINCMGWDEWRNIFGNDVDHYLNKKNEKGIAKFLMYLDNGNANAVIKYATEKMQKRRGV